MEINIRDIDEDMLFKILLENLNNIHCFDCGDTAADHLNGDDCLLGCLRFDEGDPSVGIGESVFWECPNCCKDRRK